MKNSLVLLRHGQSEWNLENRFSGLQNVPLTKKGEAEAKKAGAILKKAGIAFDQVFCSTLIRAKRTAEIALNHSGHGGLYADMICHVDLRERDYGELTGQDKDKACDKYGKEQVYLWRRSYDVAPPGGESMQDLHENRVRPYFFSEIKPALEANNNVLVVAHNGSLRAILLALALETEETCVNMELPNAKPLVIGFENGVITKRCFL